ncbi:hypothetical protein [Jannaschia rubra]|uniref:Uncharacterized protein n=1 Tax=Jannaschia rubra TaxID=282197 RepID=A0A0M6XPV9_9RHOB|nr:hypothetical protein [Jannaschia rubra]CTQ32064.1 hypothetical protein JAN5088_00825 [Jannaschia rubra]SFG38486.1 hypothetical protein SAMN04488517_104169 [Jannaschia rubra]
MADDPNKRLAELRDERAPLVEEREKARAEATQDMIAGKKPAGTAAALAERIQIVDDAIAELRDRSAHAAASQDRAKRTRQVQGAIDTASDRRKLAEAVDKALTDLAANWSAYREAVRNGVGQTAAAGGDVGPIDRVLTNNRASEALIKAMIAAGGSELSRAFGIDTPIKVRHSISLTDAERRVAESLNLELLRLRAASPQTHLAAQAAKELEALK